MISLLSEPRLEVERQRSSLVLWVCHPFDDHYSFRTLFAGITTVLQRSRPVSLTLPSEAPSEDFVEGVLHWGPSIYQVYYERSLGYVEISSAEEPAVRELLAAL